MSPKRNILTVILIVVVLIILLLAYIVKSINDYYSKQHYLSKSELSGLLHNVHQSLTGGKKEAFANANLIFEGYPLKIEKFDKNKDYVPSAIDMLSRTQYLRANSADYKFVVIFDVKKKIKGQLGETKFYVLVQDPDVAFTLAGFDIGSDGVINTKILFRVYINSKNEMIYNDMVLKNVE